MNPKIQDDVNNALWKACDTFRGVVDASDYKNYVLIMLFLKYISDLRHENLNIGKSGVLHFELPEPSRFESILHYRNTRDEGLGLYINNALRLLEEANPKLLKGVFRGTDFDSLSHLGKPKDRQIWLSQLVDDFKVLDLRLSIVIRQDVIGNAYEFLIARFAAGAGKKAGEFYTPHGVSSLITELMDPKLGESICDPACGSGSLLVQCGAKIINRQRMGYFKLYGQEKMGTTWTLARMNMLLHGVENSEIAWGDTLLEPAFRESETELSVFEVVVANPPFSMDKWGFEKAAEDPFGRFFRGIPPRARGDYAFISHMIQIMHPTKGRAAVVAPNGALFRGGAEKRIRKALIEENLLDAVIGLPSNMFYGTAIPAVILVFRRKKRDDKVLFMDVSNQCVQGKNQNIFSEKDVGKIAKMYRNRRDVSKTAALISLNEIREHDYNLNISRYIDKAPEIDAIPDAEIIALNRALDQMDAELALCRKEMNKYLWDMGYDI